MKKIWNVRKEKEGVSPVIATILMVAITVVLAAVLYVMVMGIDPDDIDLQGGAIDTVDIRSNSSVEITFGKFTGTAKPTQLKVMLETIDGQRTSLRWPTAPDNESYEMASSDPAISATYWDYVPVANEINNGDSIIVYGLASGQNYEIKLVTNDGDNINLMGRTTFTLTE